jgi:glycine cleavage system H protein
MQFPDQLRYHPEHTWARIEGGVAVVGITDFAQDELGDVVFVELPEAGRQVQYGSVFGSVESSKSISELFSPVDGTVLESNGGLEDSPELINDDPYGAGWLMKVQLATEFDATQLQDASTYADQVGAG